MDKIRVIVFQDTGDKLKLPLFDTKVPYKPHPKTYSSSSSLSSSEKHSYSKPGSLSLIYKTPRRYSHYGNDKHSQSWTSNEFGGEHSPVYKKRVNINIIDIYLLLFIYILNINFFLLFYFYFFYIIFEK